MIEPKPGTGIAALEAPRGTLIHNYHFDSRGVCTAADIVTPPRAAQTLPADLARLIALSQAVPEKADAARKRVEPSFLERVGESGLAAWTGGQAMLGFLGDYYMDEGKGDKAKAAEYEKKFHANNKAWGYFQTQAPYYQRTACAWVMTAKKEETRLRRLAILIEDSAQGRRIAVMGQSPEKPSV